MAERWIVIAHARVSTVMEVEAETAGEAIEKAKSGPHANAGRDPGDRDGRFYRPKWTAQPGTVAEKRQLGLLAHLLL